jgi:hypothetical protein
VKNVEQCAEVVRGDVLRGGDTRKEEHRKIPTQYIYE